MDDDELPSISDLAWVEYVHWPSQQNLRSRYARIGVARLFLVDGDASLPPAMDSGEDWIRVPAAALDVRARAERLATSRRPDAGERLYLGDDRLLHRGSLAVPLSRVQAMLLSVLLERPDVVVPRAELAQRVWRTTTPTEAAIDAAMHRLRQRVVRAQLSIRAVRGRGFVLHVH